MSTPYKDSENNWRLDGRKLTCRDCAHCKKIEGADEGALANCGDEYLTDTYCDLRGFGFYTESKDCFDKTCEGFKYKGGSNVFRIIVVIVALYLIWKYIWPIFQ